MISQIYIKLLLKLLLKSSYGSFIPNSPMITAEPIFCFAIVTSKMNGGKNGKKLLSKGADAYNAYSSPILIN
jgi:hypothetical protein